MPATRPITGDCREALPTLAADSVMRVAYADPPYPGQAHRYPENTEVDHAELIGMLCSDYPAGWALSTSSPALPNLLRLCPDDIRIAAWVKPFAVFKPNVCPAYAWEPVIFRGGRKRQRDEDTVRDWHSASITFQRGVIGAKPDSFCYWIFDLLGMRPGDELIDLYPGSGAVTRAWKQWKAQRRFLAGGVSEQAPLLTAAEEAK